MVVIADDTLNDIKLFRSTASKLTTKANKKDTGTETISMLILKSQFQSIYNLGQRKWEIYTTGNAERCDTRF